MYLSNKEIKKSVKKIVISITGASGSLYALNLIKALKNLNSDKIEVMLIASEIALQVFKFETSISLKELAKSMGYPLYKEKQFFAPMASGTFKFFANIIIPCSMGTLGRIANGISSNLIERTADVTLKEKRMLILSIRETPLNSIHLKNMLKISKLEKTHILPPLIAFYNKPKTIQDTIDFHIGKIFSLLKIPHSFYKEWKF